MGEKRTEPDVPNARWWAALNPQPAKDKNKQAVFLECERFFDARRVAQVLLCVPDVVLTPIEESEAKPAFRTQVRWVGSAAGPVNDKRIQVRDVKGKNVGPWRDLV